MKITELFIKLGMTPLLLVKSITKIIFYIILLLVVMLVIKNAIMDRPITLIIESNNIGNSVNAANKDVYFCKPSEDKNASQSAQ